MKTTDTLRAMWFCQLKKLRSVGYDPYNSLCCLRLGKISLSWRPE